MLSNDRALAESFGADADQYDRARPSYPAELVDELVARSPGRAVLDVGCGTGIASRLFAERGCLVLGVEPDPRMAAVARRHGIDVEEATFEHWDAADRTFDLVTCAQAWHWVDPARGAEKAAAVLAPGGLIGLFWNEGSYGPALTPVLRAVYERHAPALDDYSILLGKGAGDRITGAARALASSGRFEEPTITTYEWVRVYTRQEWLDHLPTHSDHRALAAERLAPLLAEVANAIDDFGGHLPMQYTAWLVSAGRLG